MADEVKETDSKKDFLIGDCQSIPRDGAFGMINRFTIYISNFLTTQGNDNGCEPE